ncbi:MAG: hypothetical protein IAI50_03115, partial [Candidatus Eremiobacteraeota bacterium]|nr:hypothetical protein [Candidatus Eremiobacteraeota bacterium]
KGAFYGTTNDGGGSGCGGNGCGVVYKLAPSGSSYTESVLYAFSGGTDGALPLFGSLIADNSGSLYGTTQYGGTSTNCRGPQQPTGCGVVFKLTPSGTSYTESVLYSFKSGKDGAYPLSGLIANNKGVLFGTTSQGGNGSASNCPAGGGTGGCGTIFKLTPSGKTYKESLVHTFEGGVDGAYPDDALIADSKGALYTTTELGGGGGCSVNGVLGCGSVVKLTPGANGFQESIIHSFGNSPDGAFPYDTLALDATTGALYGTTINGGANTCSGYTCGTIFRLTPSGSAYSETVLHSFGGTDGALPVAGLVIDGGLLYGATIYGGNQSCSFSNIPGCGALFSINPTGAGFKVVHDFQGSPSDGAGVYATPLLGANGKLYGTTFVGGAANDGSVYQLTPAPK